MSDVYGHSTGPEEKRDKSMVDNIGEEYTVTGVEVVFITLKVQGVADSKKKITIKDIAEESKCYLAKKIASEILKHTVDDDCNEYEETRYENGNRVENTSKFFTLFGFYLIAH